ncbi:GNAT family N-acetyltransferase [Acetobacter oeni]|uniref:N-acetyltransferase domain-containing protein n=1 Tax=Acetobacter oeni TaxID=304077 RepID=A0A511XMP2_9PROT|nr:GNAT family protein [Acetobacter oeni]MBB3884142.1 ribosomal-protein-alanine N-acetyltransferase [Acetobacter oeni]NHO20144.1 GNAT family N-acetyltransferase [Acetobacter oeni]GBR04365.1 N-acetyltransferase GCN5 [Acetobacter oeni LMG 21952]GEN64212.1 hypothetical protein AOE01nite_24360 [Acetobacter oeni]
MTSDDIFISPVKCADAPELIRANQASRDYHAPWAEPFTDEAGFDTWYGQILTGPGLGFVARHAQTREIVGLFTLSQIVWGVFRSAYLGYYGMKSHAGRGFMTASLKQVIAHTFSDIGLHRLEANIQPGNTASIALARRAGFRREGLSPCYLKIAGQWRDHERWAILATDSPIST